MNSLLTKRLARLALNKKGQGIYQTTLMSTNAGIKVKFRTLAISVPNPFVYHVELNRPKKLNAIDDTMWTEIGECFTELDNDPDCRVIVLSGAGKLFCAGLDFSDVAQMGTELAEYDDVARKCKIIFNNIKKYQESITSLEKCCKPVISAVHGGCIGGAVDLITAADIRVCTNDAWFQVKEVDIGMAADVGTLQRLPRVIGNQSLVRELAFTARKMMASEAKESGLVSRVYEDKDSMMKGVIELANDIAARSPVAVQGTKRSIIYSRDHSVQEGLDNIRVWNMAMLQSEDFMNATVAQASKSPPPTFSKL